MRWVTWALVNTLKCVIWSNSFTSVIFIKETVLQSLIQDRKGMENLSKLNINVIFVCAKAHCNNRGQQLIYFFFRIIISVL